MIDWDITRSDGKSNREHAAQLRDTGLSWGDVGARFGVSGDCARKAARMCGKTRIVSASEDITEELALKYLKDHGYQLHKHAEPTDRVVTIDTSRFDGHTYRVGIVSDTHLSSRYAQMSFLRSAYRYFAEHGINTVLHAGDVCAGHKMYPGQEYEIVNHGAGQQVEYAVNEYPDEPGVNTEFIIGNHDAAFKKGDGIDIGELIAARRPDMHYHGVFAATLQFDNIKVSLLHPDGGVPYARSYRTQRIVEQMSPDTKPHILIVGHLHTNNIMPMYRNVYVAQIGCMESQTPYLRRKGLYPEIGFGVLEFGANEHGSVWHRHQWFPCYVPKENDF